MSSKANKTQKPTAAEQRLDKRLTLADRVAVKDELMGKMIFRLAMSLYREEVGI